MFGCFFTGGWEGSFVIFVFSTSAAAASSLEFFNFEIIAASDTTGNWEEDVEGWSGVLIYIYFSLWNELLIVFAFFERKYCIVVFGMF